MPAVTAADLILPPPTEGSREVAARVARARAPYRPSATRHSDFAGVLTNSAVPSAAARGRRASDSRGARRCFARPPTPCGCRRAAIIACCGRRAHAPADLDGSDKVGRVHLAEALSYRALMDQVQHAA